MATIATGSTEDTVSDWAAPAVGGLIGAGIQTAGTPYQVYNAPRVALPSDLQNKAFTGIQNVAAPTSFAQGQAGLSDVYSKTILGPGYQGATFGTQFNAPPAYTGGTFNAGTVSSGLGAPGDIASYMSPYLQNVVDVQAREARRQADIQRANDAQKFQGAFGGGRQALYDAENVRNVNQQIGDIQAKGLQHSYDTALKQRLAEGEQYRLGQEATAKLGLEAQKAGEESQQFGAKQRLATSELAAKYGLEGLKAGEESRQFGAGLGLKYLDEAGSAATNLSALGTYQGKFDLDRLKAISELGSTQRSIDQEGLTADYRDFLEQRDWDKTQQKYLKDLMSGYPMATRNTYGEPPSTAALVLGGGLTAAEVYNKLYGKQPEK